MPMKERTGRNRVSKANQVTGKIPGNQVPSGRSRVSKADQVARKVDSASRSTPSASVRVRPSSKVDEISRKIPSNPAPSPSRPADRIPQQPSARVPQQPGVRVPTQPSSRVPRWPRPRVPYIPQIRRNSGCCLLPFALIVMGVIGALTAIF